MTVLQKAIAITAVIVTVALVVALGIRQYGNARVAAQELGTVKEAVAEAQEARKEAVKVDARQAKEIAVVRREMAAVAHRGKELDAEIRAGADCPADDPERLRLLNDAIDRTNRLIESAGKL